MTQVVYNAVLKMVIVLCVFVHTAESMSVFNVTVSEGTTISNVSDTDASHSGNVTHSVVANTTSKAGCFKKRTSTQPSVKKGYDEVGAKNFIIVTVALYALVGTVTLLLLRVCRRARRFHMHKDRMEEQVNNYLRVSSELKDAGNRYRMLCETQRTALTLTLKSIPQRHQRKCNNAVELDRQRTSMSLDEVDSGSDSSVSGITHAETSFSASSDLGGDQTCQLLGRNEQRALAPVDELMDETT